MAIVINDWFEVSASGPIDDRLVKDNISARDAIVKKYVGLKVYVKSEDKTYVYNSQNQWVLDGGSNNNNNNVNNTDWTTNIYGSGSVTNDFELFLGTVSNSKNDRSFYYNLWSRGLTDKDENRMLSYFYRTQNANDYDTMAFRFEQELKPNGLPSQFGAYIDFNANPTYSMYRNTSQNVLVNFDILQRKNLLLGVSDGSNKRIPRLSIDSNYVNIHVNQNIPSLPNRNLPDFRFHILQKNDSYSEYYDVVMGVNTSTESNVYFTQDYNHPGYRIRYGVQEPNSAGVINDRNGEKNLWSFDIRPSLRTTSGSDFGVGRDWTTVLQFNNKLPINQITQSPVSLMVDSSINYLNSTVGKNFQLLNPLQIIRNIEHKYDKIQMLGKGSARYQVLFGKYTRIFLDMSGNSFDITLPSDTMIAEMVFEKNNKTIVVPEGTIVTVKFRNQSQSNPAFINLINDAVGSSNATNTGYFMSEVSDATFFGTDSGRLTIFHEDNNIPNGESNFGDIITFRMVYATFFGAQQNVWEIINVNRQHRITKRSWVLDRQSEIANGTNQEFWYWGTTTTGFNRISILKSRLSSGTWFDLLNTQIINDGNTNRLPPGTWSYNGDSNSIGQYRHQTNPNNFRFRMSVDGNKLVYGQGNFRLVSQNSQQLRFSISTNNYFHFKSEGKKNVISVGYILTNKVAFVPNLESNWTYVLISGTAKANSTATSVNIIFTECIFTINKEGHMMIEFFAEPENNNTTLNTSLVGLEMDIFVPPFTYHAVDLLRYQRNN